MSEGRGGTITAAVITALGTIIAALITAHSCSHPTADSPSGPGSSNGKVMFTNPAASITPSQSRSSGGSLVNIPQTPSGRQDYGALTCGTDAFPDSFRLNVPEGAATYSYAIDGQWSTIKLCIDIADNGNLGITAMISITLDNQGVAADILVPGIPQTFTLNAAGKQTLTINFSQVSSGQAVYVAGELQR